MGKELEIEEKYVDPTLNISLDTIALEKQAIVFVNTRRGAESQAEKIAAKTVINLQALSDKILNVLPKPTKQCKRLAGCVAKGIAFHHSGLHPKQRELIEDNFRSGKIKIICSTPTLAAGLSMPAYRVILRDLKRFGQRGMQPIPVLEYEQMCIPGDLRVKTSKGDIPIKNIKLDDKVLTYNEITSKFSYKNVLKKHERKSRTILRLTTNRGIFLELTPNHPVYVKKQDKWSWIPGKYLVQNDEIFVTTKSSDAGMNRIPFFDFLPKENVYFINQGNLINKVKNKRKLSDRILAKELGMLKKNIYHYKYNKKSIPLKTFKKLHRLLETPQKEIFKSVKSVKSKSGNKMRLPCFVDEDFLWLAGIIATDGTLTSTVDKRTKSRHVKIRIGNKNKKIIEKSKTILEKITEGKIYVNERYKDYYELEKGCTLLADILRNGFGIPHGAKSKIVTTPRFLMDSSPDLVGAYLAGVFDGDGSYNKPFRINFCSASKKFAQEIQQLLLKLGIVSSLRIEKAGQTNLLKGKKITFSKNIYVVNITKRSSIKKLSRFMRPVKCKFITEYSKYNNLHKYRDTKQDWETLIVKNIKATSFNKEVFNLTVEDNNNYFVNNILVHNCGRAGRPEYDTVGEAICIANGDSEKEAIWEKYIDGEPEEITSKLAVEPVLRIYVLSLIASNFCQTKDDLYDFFEKTFYAHRYSDSYELHAIIDKMIDLLQEWEMIKAEDFVSADENNKITATILGKRVSELYLDPYTANFMITCMRRASSIKRSEFSWLQMICACLEMRPLLRVKNSEYEKINELSLPHLDELLQLEPSEFDYEYDRFLNSIKTALFFKDWINEITEDVLLEKFDIRPGEVKAKLAIADWLFYGAQEIAMIMGFKPFVNEIARVRERVKYGVKAELLPLLKLKGIGRVRARKMYRASVKDLGDVKKAEVYHLVEILGQKLTIDVKKQVGIDLDKAKVPQRKRKGQINLKDF